MPPSIDGEVKKPKNNEIHAIESIPRLKLLAMLIIFLSNTKNTPQLNRRNGNINDDIPNQLYKNRFDIL
jgi:hypothetical protein